MRKMKWDFITVWFTVMVATAMIMAITGMIGISGGGLIWLEIAVYCFFAVFAEFLLGVVPAEVIISKSR
ncbi:MAG: hypothetical protein WCV85_04285 [Patescibacteria group bacterium]|jgi:hypothetical protein